MAARGQHQPSPPHALPSISSLTNGLPPTSQPSPHALQNGQSHPARDSGAWLNSQSKHTSVNSGLHVSTLLNPEDTRGSVPSTPTSTRLSQHSHALPSINQGFEPQRDSFPHSHGTLESRRSSVDSRMHSGFGSLALNNAQMSPYESQHPSQVSLAASLRRPEGQTQLSPLSSRSAQRQLEQQNSSKVAPPIVPNPRQFGAPDPTAVKPTQGFPWAFPDSIGPSPDEERHKRRASSSESSTSHKMSRQNSFAASSIRSSVLSADSQMPLGQRRFEEGMGFQKIIGPAPIESVPEDEAVMTPHTMQHRSVTQLQSEEHGMNGMTGGYSRTPELRVSHKLAERKRRSEMKDLFEELNKAVPQNGGAKASKWEILSKAIDYIRSQREGESRLHDEAQHLRIELDRARDLRNENEQMRVEVGVMLERLRRLDPNSTHIYGAYTSHLMHGGQQQQEPPAIKHNVTAPLPPLPGHQSQHHHQQPQHIPPQQQQQQQQYYQSASQSAPMQGVEYALPTRTSYEVR